MNAELGNARDPLWSFRIRHELKQREQKRMRQPQEYAVTAVDRWGRELYDYTAKKIADPAACDLDLRDGWWIRCSCCRGRKYTMRNPFDTQSWVEHKRSKSHITGAIKLGISESHAHDELPQRASATPSFRVRPKTVPIGESALSQHTDSSCSSPASTPSRDGEQAVLLRVIDSLSGLVSEQQDDILALRARLQQMQRDITQITSAFGDVQDSQFQLSQSVCSYLDEVASQSSQSRSLSLSQSTERRHSYPLRSLSARGYDTEDTDCSSTDMSLAVDQSH